MAPTLPRNGLNLLRALRQQRCTATESMVEIRLSEVEEKQGESDSQKEVASLGYRNNETIPSADVFKSGARMSVKSPP